jgi:hypothetical protein
MSIFDNLFGRHGSGHGGNHDDQHGGTIEARSVEVTDNQFRLDR